MKHLIIIAGPTAVGKTAVSVEIARHFNTVVISADSRQVYKEMMIGTARPSAEEIRGVPHFLIGSHSITQPFNAYIYEQEALEILNKTIWPDKSLALVAGGTGLYIHALCQGIDEMPDIAPELRQKWIDKYKSHGLEYVLNQLKKKDLVYYNEVDKNNPKRILRALEVIETSGQPFSSFRTKHKASRAFGTIKIGLERDREELYQRINLRVDQMIADGLLAEAEQLYKYKELKALQTVGYQELFGYFDGLYDRNEAIRLLKRNSRHYAKRQMTWFKKDPEFQWFHPSDIHKIRKYIQLRLT